MKTSEQIVAAVAISAVAVLAIIIGTREFAYRSAENARAAKASAERIQRAEQMAKLRTIERAERDEASRRAALEERLAHYGIDLRNYARLHPETSPYWDLVAARKVSIGMPAALVEMAVGRPERINKTITASTDHSQWVYGDNYVYIEDGVVTAIQTSK